MNETMAAWGIGIGITILLGVIAKFADKEKLKKMTGPVLLKLGVTISTVSNLRLGEKNQEKVENGLYKTIIDVLIYDLEQLWVGLKSDNKGTGNEK